ncbi:hypothetical protein KIPB_011294, partial [Kipferlia bialata]
PFLAPPLTPLSHPVTHTPCQRTGVVYSVGIVFGLGVIVPAATNLFGLKTLFGVNY